MSSTSLDPPTIAQPSSASTGVNPPRGRSPVPAGPAGAAQEGGGAAGAAGPAEGGEVGEEGVDADVEPGAQRVDGAVLPGLQPVAVHQVVRGLPVVEGLVAIMNGVEECTQELNDTQQ